MHGNSCRLYREVICKSILMNTLKKVSYKNIGRLLPKRKLSLLKRLYSASGTISRFDGEKRESCKKSK